MREVPVKAVVFHGVGDIEEITEPAPQGAAS
jgi:hypothetical protein